ncbi:MAG: HIT family protein [Thermoanaerobaculia bacterium]|nr:HIT family protein [Thermoanaerobaculia bacterium]
MHETIFDEVLAGTIPCYRIYEDEWVLAFLDINPLSPGHTLVIPKERAAYLHELSEESSAAIGRTLPMLCRAVMEATGIEDYNVLQNNGHAAHQAVFHVHFHIIPRLEDRGLDLEWSPGELSPEDAEDLLAALHRSLGTDD